jgi:hypothetical protein
MNGKYYRYLLGAMLALSLLLGFHRAQGINELADSGMPIIATCNGDTINFGCIDTCAC